MTTQPGAAISKRRKFVADGVFYAELNEFFQRELAEEGYSGVEVRVTPTVTDISTLSPLTPLTTGSHSGSHTCDTYTGSPWRARSPNPRTHLIDPETIQVPRELGVALRRQGPEPWLVCRRTMRIAEI